MPEHKAVIDEIRDVLNARKQPGFDDLPAKVKFLMLTAEITEATCAVMHGLNPANKDQLEVVLPQYVEAAEALFDELVVPLDLPINDAVEGYMEATLRSGIKPAVESLVRRLVA